MAVLTKGTTYSTGNQVNAANLNDHVDGAVFASGAVDDVSTQIDGTGAIVVKDGGIDTAKIADGAVATIKNENATSTSSGITFPKIRHIANNTVIGNTSGGTTNPSEVTIYDEDDMASNSDVGLATQQSTKSYIDTSKSEAISEAQVKIIHLRDEKSSNTTGDSINNGSGWKKLTLNTEKTNTIVGASLSSSQITLPSGTYILQSSTPIYNAFSNSQVLFKTRIYNSTDLSVIDLGQSTQMAGLDQNSSFSYMLSTFVLADTKTIEIQARCSDLAHIGVPYNTGSNEIYTDVKIMKIA